MNAEVMISLQMVCQETHSTLKGHQDCTHRKHFHLQICEGTATAFQKSFYIHLKQMKVTGHFGNILLILCCRACAKTDGITKIICRKSRHYRVQIDHTDSLMCSIIDHDIIQLCVIVRYTKRQLTCIL